MYSMTGYGRATCMKDGRSLTIELKSVNHRFLDLNFRMPRSFLFLEDAARKQATQWALDVGLRKVRLEQAGDGLWVPERLSGRNRTVEKDAAVLQPADVERDRAGVDS